MPTHLIAISNFAAQKNGLKIVNEPYPHKLCRICDSNKDLSKPWYVEYYVFDEKIQKLKRRRVVLAENTAKERYAKAKAVSKEIDALLKEGAVMNPSEKAGSTSKSISENSKLINACTYFLEFNKNTLKKRTQESYATDIKRFVDFLQRNKLADLNFEKFDDVIAMQFLDELIVSNKISNRSRNNVKGTMSTFFNFFRKRKIIQHNPFAEIKKLSQTATKHAAFTKKQIQLFKESCLKQGEGQLWLFINFIYFAFTRPRFELRLLKVVDIKEKTILIRAENAKNNATEHIMIPEPLEKIIALHGLRSFDENFYVFSENGEPGLLPLGRDFMYNRHRKILNFLKLNNQNYDMYSWKHTGVIALFQATQNMELIRQQCRHSDIATTQKYLRDLGLFIDYDQINKFPEI